TRSVEHAMRRIRESDLFETGHADIPQQLARLSVESNHRVLYSADDRGRCAEYTTGSLLARSQIYRPQKAAIGRDRIQEVDRRHVKEQRAGIVDQQFRVAARRVIWKGERPCQCG